VFGCGRPREGLVEQVALLCVLFAKVLFDSDLASQQQKDGWSFMNIDLFFFLGKELSGPLADRLRFYPLTFTRKIHRYAKLRAQFTRLDN